MVELGLDEQVAGVTSVILPCIEPLCQQRFLGFLCTSKEAHGIAPECAAPEPLQRTKQQVQNRGTRGRSGPTTEVCQGTPDGKRQRSPFLDYRPAIFLQRVKR